MILVRDVLQVKWNEMDKVLAALKAAAEHAPETLSHRRVLTDLSGNYFTLVIETKAESMDAYWENMRAGMAAQREDDAANMLGQLAESGYREFFNIEHEGEGF